MVELAERSYEVYIDLATGLYDRRTMWSRLAEEVARARRYHYALSLMLITVDTSDPHRALERLLELSKVLKQHTRTADILVRYSEDTLALLLPCTDERGALQLAERIRHLVQVMLPPPYESGESAPIRIGVTSTSGEYSGDKVALVEQVEWALRKTQRKGGENRTVVVPAPQDVSPDGSSCSPVSS
jgi:diguanylate cyclase (GGDEF)-like protein